MMNVRTMALVADEASAGKMPQIAVAAAQRWGCNENSLKWHRSSANHIFTVELNGRRHWLRLAHSSEREKHQIGAELDFVAHVAIAGIPVARPLPSLGGERLEEVATGGDHYCAVLFEGLVGRQLGNVQELTPEMLRSWGSTVARVHTASQGFVPRGGCCRPSWEGEFQAAERSLPGEEEAARRELDRTHEWLRGLPADTGTFGLIHGDPELDNLVWDGLAFQVLDFDSAVYYWYAADIAKAVSDLWESDSGGGEAYQRFLEGYQEVMGPVELLGELIPRFQRAARVLDFARLLNCYRNVDPSEDQPWRAQMRQRHAAWLSRARDVFAKPSE